MRQLESLRNLSSDVCEVRPCVSREGATSLALEHSPISPRIVSQARVAARGIGAVLLLIGVSSFSWSLKPANGVTR